MIRAGGVRVAGRPLLVIASAWMDALWSAPVFSSVRGFINLNPNGVEGWRIVPGKAHQKHISRVVPGQGRIGEQGEAGHRQGRGIVPGEAAISGIRRRQRKVI